MGAAPAIIAALSAGAQVYNQNKVAKDQAAITSQGLNEQAANQRNADEEVQRGIGEVANASPDEARKEATNAFLDQLRRNRSQTMGADTAGGSDRFNDDTAAAKAGVAQYGEQAADVQGRINAPALQRQNESVSTGRLASNLAQYGRNARATDFLTRLRAGAVQQDPWINAGAELGQGVAGGMAASGGRTRPPSTVPVRQGYVEVGEIK